MRKIIIILILSLLILSLVALASGYAPIVMHLADAVGLTKAEVLELLSSKDIPAPQYETSEAVSKELIQQIFTLTNKEREASGLSLFESSEKLDGIAMLRALDMAEKHYFEHESPTGETAFSLMNEYGVICMEASENIAVGDVSAEEIVQLWMDSPSHRESILSDKFQKLGIGIVRADDGEIYWVQIFSN